MRKKEFLKKRKGAMTNMSKCKDLSSREREGKKI